MTGYRDGFSSAELGPAQYEPVAASFYGLRAFQVDKGEGRTPSDKRPAVGGELTGQARVGGLRSIFRSGYVWGPGVNNAQCLAAGPTIQHKPVDKDCDCGFWAYTNGSHVLSVAGPSVVGVVQGWGRMVIGPHGFRCERAQIVALAEHISTPPIADQPLMLVATFSPRAALRMAVQRVREEGPGYVRTAIELAGLPVPRAWQQQPVTAPPEPPAKVAIAGAPVSHWCPPQLFEKVRRNYPDVAVFKTADQMLASFPLSDLTALLADTEEEAS